MAPVSWATKLFMLAVFSVAYTFLYIWPNFRPLWEPVYLPLLAIDQQTPLVPWTFIIYLSDYLLFTVAFVLVKEPQQWNAFARTAFGGLFLCGFFFLFYPTIYPRPQYPEVDNALVALAMQLIAAADRPTNCFPSMHVAMTSVAIWALRRQPLSVLGPLVVWALAIFASTLTTKQHYAVDILAGVTVAVVVAAADRAFVARGWYHLMAARAPFLKRLL